MHGHVEATMPGEDAPLPARDSKQLFVVTKQHGQWQVEAVQNSRRLTLERQDLLDRIDSLPADAQRRVDDFVGSLTR